MLIAATLTICFWFYGLMYLDQDIRDRTLSNPISLLTTSLPIVVLGIVRIWADIIISVSKMFGAKHDG